MGPQVLRQYVFPQSTNLEDDFIMIYGTPQDLNQNLKNLIVCQNSVGKQASVYLRAYPVDLDQVNNNGLSLGTQPTYVTPTFNGSRPNFSQYTTNLLKCG